MKEIFFDIQIDGVSSTPKYQQLANWVISCIRTGKICMGEHLPSINTLSEILNLSRDTVEKAYRLLKKKKVIVSCIGRGYFVTGDLGVKMHIALFLNKMSFHKKEFYEAFKAQVKDQADLDLFIYDGDINKLQGLLQRHEQSYDYIAIFPYFSTNRDQVTSVFSLIPTYKLVLLGTRLEGLEGRYTNIFEDHENDIFEALSQLQPTLSKYQTLKLVYPDGSDYPRSLIKGFYTFCQEHGYAYSLVDEVVSEVIEKGTCYITIPDDDLVLLLEKITDSGLGLGREVGVIAYNETAWKRCLMNGITTITVDARQMGLSAGTSILQASYDQVRIPAKIRQRGSC